MPRLDARASSRDARGLRALERGSNSIQMALLLPVLFLVMFLGMQAALYYQARTVAIAAAQEGARAAGAETGTTGRGIDAAGDFVADAGGDDVLAAVTVTGRRTATTVTMTVRGQAMSVIPGWAPAVEQSATAAVERLT